MGGVASVEIGMPRYFFDVINSQGPMRDDEGLELPTAEAVTSTAALMLLDLARDEIVHQQNLTVSVRVRDDHDLHIFASRLGLTSQWLDTALDVSGQTIGSDGREA
jgi:hypothetical protein